MDSDNYHIFDLYMIIGFVFYFARFLQVIRMKKLLGKDSEKCVEKFIKRITENKRHKMVD